MELAGRRTCGMAVPGDAGGGRWAFAVRLPAWAGEREKRTRRLRSRPWGFKIPISWSTRWSSRGNFQVVVDREVKREGGASIRLANPPEGGATFPRMSQTVALAGGARYVLSAWVRSPDGRANMQVTRGGHWFGSAEFGSAVSIPAGEDWRRVEKRFAAAEEAPEARVIFTLLTPNREGAELRVDKVALTAVPDTQFEALAGRIKPGDVVLLEGGTYEQPQRITFSGTADAPVVVRPADGQEVVIRNTTWTLVGALGGPPGYITVENNEIFDCNHGLHIKTSDNVLRGNHIRDMNFGWRGYGTGIYLRSGPRTVVENI